MMRIIFALSLIFSMNAFANNPEKKIAKQTDKLIEAIRVDDVEAARKAIKKGADVNSLMREHFKLPLLIRAAKHNQVEMVKLLLENKAKVDALRPTDGYSALMIAARNNFGPLSKVLLAHKADVTIQGSLARNALDIGANMNSIEVVKNILENGENVDMNNRLPFHCPLSIAARDGHAEIVTLFLAQKTGPKAPSKECIELAVKEATKFDRTAILELLSSAVACE